LDSVWFRCWGINWS